MFIQTEGECVGNHYDRSDYASTIASLAFQEFIKSSAGELAKKFTNSLGK
jgi:hypothetical protein